MPGDQTHPQPRVRKEKAHELVTTGAPNDPAFPARMVLTVSFVLSPVNGLCCHRPLRDAGIEPEGPTSPHHRKVGISVAMPGPHDFAVRLCLRSSFANKGVHRFPAQRS